MLLRFVLAFCLALSLSACDSSDPNGPSAPSGPGAGSITVSGAVSSSFSGSAFFTSIVDEDDEFSFVGIFKGDLMGAPQSPDNVELVLLGREGGLFGTGTYALTDSLESGSFIGEYVRIAGDSYGAAFSESGSLTVASATSSRMDGSFSFTGPLLSELGASSGSVTVQGSFSAIYVDPDTLPGGVEPDFRAAAQQIREAALAP